ncbi:ABC transporter permease SP1688 [Streptococcus pneumoniae]|nr:ABC transporter permease SP1688 [Streptococcus pneumoniae]
MKKKSSIYLDILSHVLLVGATIVKKKSIL